MKCSGCGAENVAAAVVCEFCQSALAITADNAQEAALERVKASAVYAARNSAERQARLPDYTAGQKVLVSVFFAMFIGVALFIFVVALVMAGFFGVVGRSEAGGPGAALSLVSLCISVVPLLFVALGVWALVHTTRKMRTQERAPVEAVAAVVVDKRTHVSGGGHNSSASTAYYVTCQTEDGQRREYRVWGGEVFGKLAAGDAGVLFIHAGCALDFDRV